VKQMGVIEGQPILSSNEWESIEDQGDEAVKKWIESNLRGKDCLIVLIGTETSQRRWVKYEIKRACEKGMGVLGVLIHRIKDVDGLQAAKGTNPFAGVNVDGEAISAYARVYDPPYTTSPDVYEYIADNLSTWVDKSIELRA
jgi:hypothetical protein